MKNKLKTIALTLIAALIITAMPVGTVTAEAASKPAQVKNLKKTTVTSNSITVKFKKVKNIKGYQIRVYNTKNKLVKSKTTTKTKYKITGLKASTKYKIKVRAYTVRNKKKIYGKLSNTITIKTKKKTTKTVTPTPTVKPSNQTLKKQYEEYRNNWLKDNITAEIKANPEVLENYILSFIDIIKIKNNGTDDMYLAYERQTGSGKAAVKMIADVYQQFGIKTEIIDDIEAYREKEKNYYGCKDPADKYDKITGWCLVDNRKQYDEEYYAVTLVQVRSGIVGTSEVLIPIEQMEYFAD